jgi:hypothetical protein
MQSSLLRMTNYSGFELVLLHGRSGAKKRGLTYDQKVQDGFILKCDGVIETVEKSE